MVDKKPRIAFCFAWQARTLNQTYQLFQQNLFDAAKEQWFDYDVFCAVEDDNDSGNVDLLNPVKVEKIKSSNVEKIIEEKYWDFIRNEFPTKYSHAWTGKATFNMLQQYYKVSKSIHLKIEHEKNNNIEYDVVFKLRFDAPFPRKLNFNKILCEIKKNDNNVVICNKHKKSIVTRVIWTEIIDDLYFIMGNNASTALANIFEDWRSILLWEEIKKYVKLHGIFNRFFLKLNTISVLVKKIKNDIIRTILNIFIDCPIVFFYTKFFKWQDAERWFYLCFFKAWAKICTTQISIWIIKSSKQASVLWKFKTSYYEF